MWRVKCLSCRPLWTLRSSISFNTWPHKVVCCYSGTCSVCCVVWCGVVWCDVMWCGVVCFCVVCCALLCCTVLCQGKPFIISPNPTANPSFITTLISSPHLYDPPGAMVTKYPRTGRPTKKLFRFSFVEGRIYLTWKGKLGNQGVDLGEVSSIIWGQ